MPGNREDSTYQLTDEHRNVDLPFGFMDNDYENPDIDRFLDRFREREPAVAVVGDAYDRSDADRYQQVIDDLTDTYPECRFIVAPKCAAAFDVLDPETTTLGYANGTSPVQAKELGPAKFRDWDIHILGGNPVDAYAAIQTLTQPTVDGRPPANVVGYGWNGPLRMAYWEYWTPRGWQDNGHLSPRESARRSYREMKQYLQQQGVWPDEESCEVYGPAVEQPDDHIWLDHGGEPIPDRDGLERSYVEEYDGLRTVAFERDTYRRFVEVRDGLSQ